MSLVEIRDIDKSFGRLHVLKGVSLDVAEGEIVWSLPEQFSVWSGALATAGDIVFYGTLEGYLKAVNAETGEELYRFKTPSGIIGNINTWTFDGKQYVGVLSGIGGWAGIGMAAGLTGDTEGLGAVGAYLQLRAIRLDGRKEIEAAPERRIEHEGADQHEDACAERQPRPVAA